MFNYGLSQSEFTLCARIHPAVGPNLLLIYETGSNWYYLAFEPVPGQIPSGMVPLTVPFFAPHFPFGYDVERDV